MATGNAWNLADEPPKVGYPWAWWDGNSTIDVPIYIADWMDMLGSAYASHEMVLDEGLECVSSSYSDDIIVARIKADAGATLEEDEKYGFTFRVTTANGQVDDRTLYFRVRRL